MKMTLKKLKYKAKEILNTKIILCSFFFIK